MTACKFQALLLQTETVTISHSFQVWAGLWKWQLELRRISGSSGAAALPQSLQTGQRLARQSWLGTDIAELWPALSRSQEAKSCFGILRVYGLKLVPTATVQHCLRDQLKGEKPLESWEDICPGQSEIAKLEGEYELEPRQDS